MVNIPCVLECQYQRDGQCVQETAAEIRCTNGKCPYFAPKSGKNKTAAIAKRKGSGKHGIL